MKIDSFQQHLLKFIEADRHSVLERRGLFRTNAVLVTSDGLTARIGSLTADAERFMPWRTTDGIDIAPKGQPELQTLIEGVFDKVRFLAL